jgi:lipase chaperone LimK
MLRVLPWRRASSGSTRIRLDRPALRRPSTWAWLTGAAALLALLAVQAGWLSGLRGASGSEDSAPAGRSGGWFGPGVGAGPTDAGAHFKTGLEALPASLQGTDVDGELPVDAAGHLRLVRGVRNCFDYFLSTVGEEPVQRVRERIHAYVSHQLKEPARSEALDLLNRYLNYRAALDELAQQGGDRPANSVEALRARLAQRLGLRQQMFSPTEHAAFFADEEQLDNYSVASLQIMRDASLSARDKAARIHELNATLPPDLQDAISARERYEQLTAVTQELRAQGASAEALRAVRTQIVGAEAADRLEALDAQRASWQGRLQAFQAQRAALLKDASLSDAQRTQAINQLASSSFTDAERVRALALTEEAGR